jgi:hypothetical protein
LLPDANGERSAMTTLIEILEAVIDRYFDGGWMHTHPLD